MPLYTNKQTFVYNRSRLYASAVVSFVLIEVLKWQKQREKSWKTANRVLVLIARNFRYENKELILPLYKSLVRPHLEHAVQFWSPHLRRDIDKREKILLCKIKNSNHQRIQDLDLISLLQRSLRGQLIKVFKYKNIIDSLLPVQEGSSIITYTDRTGNNGAKLIAKHLNASVAQHVYPIKTTNPGMPDQMM